MGLLLPRQHPAGTGCQRLHLKLAGHDLSLIHILRVSLEQYAITLPEIDLGKNDLLTKLTDLLAKGGSALLNTTISVTTSVLSAVVNLLMGVVFSIYILAQKETLARQLKKLLYLTFPEQKVTPFLAFLGRVSRTFSQFITGQTIEAVILGTLVLLGMQMCIRDSYECLPYLLRLLCLLPCPPPGNKIFTKSYSLETIA